MYDLISLGKSAKNASIELNKISETERNNALNICARLLRDNAQCLIKENQIDIENAKAKGMSDAFIDRLTLTDKVIEGMAIGLEQVATLKAPLGQIIYTHDVANIAF